MRNQAQEKSIPLLVRRGGRASKKCREATFDSADGVVAHRSRDSLATTPSAPLRNEFFLLMAQPPLLTRRGICVFQTFFLILTIIFSVAQVAAAQSTSPFLTQYCITCHNQRLKTADLMLDTMDFDHVEKNAAVWEKVVRKIKT